MSPYVQRQPVSAPHVMRESRRCRLLCSQKALRFDCMYNIFAPHNRFADALEAAGDPDLSWRYSFLAAVSLALGDAGDAVGAAARIAVGFQHAEAYAKREGELAEAARAVVNEVSLLVILFRQQRK